MTSKNKLVFTTEDRDDASLMETSVLPNIEKKRNNRKKTVNNVPKADQPPPIQPVHVPVVTVPEPQPAPSLEYKTAKAPRKASLWNEMVKEFGIKKKGTQEYEAMLKEYNKRKISKKSN